MSDAVAMARRRTVGDGGEDSERLIVEEDAESHQSTSSSTSSSSGIQINSGDPEEVHFDPAAGPATRVGNERHLRPLPPSPRTILSRLQSERCRWWCWIATIVVLGVFCIVIVAVPLGLWENRPQQRCLDFEDVAEEEYEEFPYLFDAGDGSFTLCKRGELKLEGTLGRGRSSIREDKVDYWLYTHNSSLNISRSDGNCLQIEWEGETSIDTPLIDCFKLGDARWYGAYEVFDQVWPLTAQNLPNLTMMPFLPEDFLAESKQDTFGPILHPLWLSSNGIGILVDRDTHLHISFNPDSGEMCLHALPFELECVPHSFNHTSLHYSVCIFDSLASTVQSFLANTAHPKSTPEREVFEKPIWSTWAYFKVDINGSVLKGFLENITNVYNFPISQLEIDDGYSKQYGELSFDPAKITSDDLRDLASDVKLTAWVHPYVNVSADTFVERLNQFYFLPGFSETVNSVSLIKWWHGYATVINFVNHTTALQHGQALGEFVSTNHLTSLKFDAGEATYMPKCTRIEGLQHPAEYANAYVRFVGSQSYVGRAEVRVGYFTQDVPVFVRILDRESKWGLDNGLQSVLTTVLAVGLAGYPFILPDMIGGNNRTADSELSAELYVRWAQLSAFLPAMQFSLPPWQFGSTVTNHVRSMIQLHRDLSDKMFNAAQESAASNVPIIRPLWWLVECIDDEPEAIWDINDQFLIGKDIMVAPVLLQNQTSRSVYFPQGTRWRKVGWPNGEDKVYGGEESTVNFNVPLYETLYFELVDATNHTGSC